MLGVSISPTLELPLQRGSTRDEGPACPPIGAVPDSCAQRYKLQSFNKGFFLKHI